MPHPQWRYRFNHKVHFDSFYPFSIVFIIRCYTCNICHLPPIFTIYDLYYWWPQWLGLSYVDVGCLEASCRVTKPPPVCLAPSCWRHQMEIFSALLAICAENSPVPGKFPVTRSFDVFFDLRLNKRFSKQSWGWWFETPSRPLWRHRNVVPTLLWENRN